MTQPTLFLLAFVACTAGAAPGRSAAQQAADASPAVHPITFPAAAAEPAPAARKTARKSGAAAAVAAPVVVPADQVHPITSLPRPAVEADASGRVAPSVPVAASGSLPAASAAVETPVVPAFTQPGQPAAQPATAPAPALNLSAPAAADAELSTSTSASAPPVSEGAAMPVVAPTVAPPLPLPDPQPADMGPAPLHAGVGAPAPSAVVAMQALPGGPNRIKPFSAVGVQFKVGFNGVGADVAVPLSQHFNARVGGTFFQYSGTYAIDGINISGEVKFRSGNIALDWFPFHGTFRISPGLTFYNGNNINASAVVPAGSTFTLNNVDYTSGCQGGPSLCPAGSDPVRGSASMTFGNRKAPSLTLGWGNMVPRHGSRFSVPFEFGVQYIDDPKITLALAGTACSTQGTVSGCGQLQSDPIAQDNLAREQQTINDDIKPLRFYPILSIGVSWSFGRKNQ